MGEKDDPPIPETRPCAVCHRELKVIKRSGSLLIKEPCGNNCGAGYVKPVRRNAGGNHD